MNKPQFTARVDVRTDDRAISYSRKPVQFILGPIGVDPRRAYGQAAAWTEYDPKPTQRLYFDRPVHRAGGEELIYLEPVTLDRLTDDLEFIDLLDMDLQGTERELIENAFDVFSAKVRQSASRSGRWFSRLMGRKPTLISTSKP